MPRKTRMTVIMPGRDSARRVQPAARQGLLSQTAEYALRAAASIAGAPRGTARTAIEVARLTGIPVHYLSKILRRLVAAGLLVSQKGHGGGFTLARPPAKVRFSEVLAAVGWDPSRNHCAFGWAACDPQKPCPLHPAWSRLDSAFREWADRTSLAEVPLENLRNARARASR